MNDAQQKLYHAAQTMVKVAKDIVEETGDELIPAMHVILEDGTTEIVTLLGAPPHVAVPSYLSQKQGVVLYVLVVEAWAARATMEEMDGRTASQMPNRRSVINVTGENIYGDQVHGCWFINDDTRKVDEDPEHFRVISPDDTEYAMTGRMVGFLSKNKMQ